MATPAAATTDKGRLAPRQPPVPPAGAPLADHVAQVDGALEVAAELLPPLCGPFADDGAEARPPRVAPQVGFREDEQVGVQGGGAAGDGGEALHGAWQAGGVGSGACRGETHVVACWGGGRCHVCYY